MKQILKTFYVNAEKKQAKIGEIVTSQQHCTGGSDYMVPEKTAY